MKKVVIIELNSFLATYSRKKGIPLISVSEVAEKFGISKQTFINWAKSSPDVVHTLFYILKENPKTDILKALKQWPKPPTVVSFLAWFLNEYKCDLTDIVREVKNA